MVAFLMDSVYKGYPFGALLFWRTREKLRHERQLGAFRLPEHDPDYPIDYVLDGQQRLTSLFGVFQSELEPDPAVDWNDIYFDLSADPGAQESQFVALEVSQVDQRRHFPLMTLFSSVEYRKATSAFGNGDVVRLDEMQAQFKEARIPVELLQTEDRTKVAIVFERINRTGVPLDTLQLLTAWTWSEDFDLQNEFEELKEELEPFGFAGVGEDSNLLLRCCAAVLAGDASPSTLVQLKGSEVRARFPEIINGVKGAIDFLKTQIKSETLENLPFSTLLVPLSVFFAGDKFIKLDSRQRTKLLRWFWRCCFSRRYSSGVLRNLREDIEAISALRNNKPTTLGDFPVLVTKEFFANTTFRINSVNSKTFVLFLAQHTPRSFVSGSPISLERVLRDYNRSEFHHIFPRAFLSKLGVSLKDQNALANFCFLSKTDNITLGGAAPSEYRGHMPKDTTQVTAILNSALCPKSVFEDDYKKFIKERALILEAAANELLEG